LDSFHRTTLVSVNGIPNVNPNNLLCREDLRVELLKTKKPFLLSLFESMLEVGFQHKSLIRKPFIWKIVKNFIFKYSNYHRRPIENSVKPAETEPSEKIEADVVVVGGGLAGLSAAIETSKRGLKTILIDDQPDLGGKARFDNSQPLGFDKPLSEFVRDLINEAKKNNVTFLSNTVLNGFWEDGVTAYKIVEPAGGKIYLINAKMFIMATGSIELPCIYENNDLPGTITASTALRLVNEYDVNIGENVVIIGVTDYSVRVASQLVDKGTNVTMITKYDSLDIQAENERILNKKGIEVIKNVKKLKAQGKDKVESIVIATENEIRTIDVDMVIFGALENSNFKLPAQAGIEVVYVNKIGFVPIHNEFMETKMENILVAGGVTGSFYEILQTVEGRIAGLTASIKLGKGGAEERDKFLKDHREFSSKLGIWQYKEKVFKIFEGEEIENEPLADVPTWYSTDYTGKQFVCFCEDITVKDLYKTVKDINFDKMELIKRYTGISTGKCQGRLCLVNAALLASKILGTDPNNVGLIRQRLPIIPIPFRVISGVELE